MTKRERIGLLAGAIVAMLAVFVLPRVVNRATAQTTYAQPAWETAIYRIDAGVAALRARMDAATVPVPGGWICTIDATNAEVCMPVPDGWTPAGGHVLYARMADGAVVALTTSTP